MSSFKKYLLWKLKGSALRAVIFTVLALMLILPRVSEAVDYTHSDISYSNCGIGYLSTLLGILCTVVPILELSGFKNRRNIDTLYFLPIRRDKMAAAHYISGFLQIFFIYSITFFASLAFLAIKTDWFALGYMIPYYFLSLLVGLLIYSIFSFIFSQANTVLDGVIFCIAWIFVVYLIICVVQDCIITKYIDENFFNKDNRAYLWSAWGLIYEPLDSLTELFYKMIEINDPRNYSFPWIMDHIYLFFIWGAVGIAAAIGYFVTFVKKGAEKAGEISDTPFGYKTLIPVIAYSAILLTNGHIISISLYVAMMVIAYVVYRRGFKFKKSDVICMLCAVPTIILLYIPEIILSLF